METIESNTQSSLQNRARLERRDSGYSSLDDSTTGHHIEPKLNSTQFNNVHQDSNSCNSSTIDKSEQFQQTHENNNVSQISATIPTLSDPALSPQDHLSEGPGPPSTTSGDISKDAEITETAEGSRTAAQTDDLFIKGRTSRFVEDMDETASINDTNNLQALCFPPPPPASSFFSWDGMEQSLYSLNDLKRKRTSSLHSFSSGVGSMFTHRPRWVKNPFSWQRDRTTSLRTTYSDRQNVFTDTIGDASSGNQESIGDLQGGAEGSTICSVSQIMADDIPSMSPYSSLETLDSGISSINPGQTSFGSETIKALDGITLRPQITPSSQTYEEEQSTRMARLSSLMAGTDQEQPEEIDPEIEKAYSIAQRLESLGGLALG